MKTMLTSRTVWLGIAVLVLGILEQFNVSTIVQGNTGLILIGLGLGIIVLRKYTKKQIH